MLERPDGNDMVWLGRIVRAQGLRGAVRIAPFGITPEIADALVGKRVWLRPPKPEAVAEETILDSSRWHRSVWIAEFAACRSRTEAEARVGWEVGLVEDERPALGDNEYYPDQLVGLAVVDDATGEVLGEVVGIQPQLAADLLEVKRPTGKRFLIPLVRAMICKVELASRSIRVNLPEGLITLNP
ncbi:MAG: ribosome maturation factor RimM [Candidatus Sumerlaeia bacterium]|nr:ribosome maturation factor RimM [Candidatus Sumerlaeia bacterium]